MYQSPRYNEQEEYDSEQCLPSKFNKPDSQFKNCLIKCVSELITRTKNRIVDVWQCEKPCRDFNKNSKNTIIIDNQNGDLDEKKDQPKDQSEQQNDQVNQQIYEVEDANTEEIENAEQNNVNQQPKRPVIAISYPYYTSNTKETLIQQYFLKFHRDKKFIIGHNTKTINYDWHFVFKPEQINWQHFKEGRQLVNHIEHIQIITNKAFMARTLNAFDKQKLYPNLQASKFSPETFILDFSKPEFTQSEIKLMKTNSSSIWILKPASGFGGSGIELITDFESFKQDFYQLKLYIKEHNKKIKSNKQLWVIQKPLLIDKKKFDYRCYVAIPCVKPFLAYLYHGFIRKSVFEYFQEKKQNKKFKSNFKDHFGNDLEGEDDIEVTEVAQDPNEQTQQSIDDFQELNFTNSNIHITNVKKQMEHPDYENLKQDTVQDQESFKHYLKVNKSLTEEQIDSIFKKIEQIVTYSLLALKLQYKQNSQVLKFQLGQYQFLAFDFIIKNDLSPILLEINSSPSWATSLENYKKLKQKFFTNTMNMVQLSQQQFVYHSEKYCSIDNVTACQETSQVHVDEDLKQCLNKCLKNLEIQEINLKKVPDIWLCREHCKHINTDKQLNNFLEEYMKQRKEFDQQKQEKLKQIKQKNQQIKHRKKEHTMKQEKLKQEQEAMLKQEKNKQILDARKNLAEKQEKVLQQQKQRKQQQIQQQQQARKKMEIEKQQQDFLRQERLKKQRQNQISMEVQKQQQSERQQKLLESYQRQINNSRQIDDYKVQQERQKIHQTDVEYKQKSRFQQMRVQQQLQQQNVQKGAPYQQKILEYQLKRSSMQAQYLQGLRTDPSSVVALSPPYCNEFTPEFLIREYFQKNHPALKIIQGYYTSTIGYLWHFAFRPEHINWKTYKEGFQLVNHIEHIKLLADKALMYTTLQNLINKQIYPNFNLSHFVPQTFLIDYQFTQLSESEQQLMNLNKKQSSGIWILKPSSGQFFFLMNIVNTSLNSFGGQGIRIINDLEDFKTDFKNYKNRNVINESITDRQWIIQKYIDKPYLIEKKKFDYRCFVAIPCSKPFVAYYRHGFIRRSVFEYYQTKNGQNQRVDMSIMSQLDDGDEIDDYQDYHDQAQDDEENNKYIDYSNDKTHITNVKQQKEHPDYENLKEDTVWNYQQFYDHMGAQKNFDMKQFERSMKKIKKICTFSIEAFIQQTRDNPSIYQFKLGQFQYLAFDFIFTSSLKPFLLEINQSPSWVLGLKNYKDLKIDLFNFNINLVIEIHKDMNDKQEIEKIVKNLKKAPKHNKEWTLLINEASEYSYLEEDDSLQNIDQFSQNVNDQGENKQNNDQNRNPQQNQINQKQNLEQNKQNFNKKSNSNRKNIDKRNSPSDNSEDEQNFQQNQEYNDDYI